MTWRDFIPVPNNWLSWAGMSDENDNPFIGHAAYLGNSRRTLQEQGDNGLKEIVRNLDWTDLRDLERDGFVDKKLAKIVPMGIDDTQWSSAGHDGDRYVVKLPERTVSGRKQYPKSIAGHEYGHIKDFIGRGLTNSSSFFDFSDKAKSLGTIDSSIESLTNGLMAAKAPILQTEERAWDLCPTGYDKKCRDYALSGYRNGIASEWKLRALDRLVSDGLITREQGEKAYKGEYDVPKEKAHEYEDFWRTNSYPNAIKYLKGLKPIRK